MTAPRLICIGTHHKTGTIWMRKVWRRISAEQNIPFMQLYRTNRMANIAPEGPQIIANWSSSFPKALFKRSDARFLHIIRDPRDVLLSGMRYHRVAPLGNEKFLRLPRPELRGKTYQEHLNDLPDDRSRLLFEMKGKHAQTVEEMLAWPYDHEHVADLRYEDLIQDTECIRFRRVLEGWGIAGLDIDAAVQTYWDLSLFGGLADAEARTARTALHVNSGQGRQWAHRLPQDVAAIYALHFGPALRQLGYAQDDQWVTECPLPQASVPAEFVPAEPP